MKNALLLLVTFFTVGCSHQRSRDFSTERPIKYKLTDKNCTFTLQAGTDAHFLIFTLDENPDSKAKCQSDLADYLTFSNAAVGRWQTQDGGYTLLIQNQTGVLTNEASKISYRFSRIKSDTSASTIQQE